MNDEKSLLVSDCLDGEPVDPDLLAQHLAHPEARELACALLVLRAAARWGEERPSEGFYDAMRGQLSERPESGPRRLRAPRRRRGRSAWRGFAAILLAALAGFALRPVVEIGQAPPDAGLADTVTVQADVPTAGAQEPEPGPPEPTRVVRFTPGVDWR